MPTPASNQNEPSKMKKLISGQMDESIRAKLPPRNGSNPPRTPASPPPYPRFVTAPQPPRQEPRLKFLPAFWTIASLMSMTVNIILIVILLILFQMLGTIQDTAGDQASGLLGGLLMAFRMAHVDLAEPATLFSVTAVLSNLVSNVPAVMLLLPVAGHSLAGAILALSSTLAGNLLIVGSIANIIVVDQARQMAVAIDWRTHAQVGIPVTLATLLLAAAWLWLIA